MKCEAQFDNNKNLYKTEKQTNLFQYIQIPSCFKTPLTFNRGIKHDFPFINIRKVPRKALKTEGEARGFQPSRGTLRMLMNNKIMFDRYYCIISTKMLQKRRNYWRTLFYSLIKFSYAKNMHDSG